MKSKINFKKSYWLLVSLVLIVIDQLSKWYVKENFELLKSKEIINGFFYITHHKNTGAAWGIFQNGTLVLAAISGIIAIVLVVFLLKMDDKFASLSLSIIIAGALGNFIDRVAFLEVTDFLDFYIFKYDFPIFNVADSCVVVGTILLSIYILFIYKEEKGIHE
ncbi:MAG: signal peptidase II [Clostridia bacterium]|nr:signal peptidase II [Clostridia bacterium]